MNIGKTIMALALLMSQCLFACSQEVLPKSQLAPKALHAGSKIAIVTPASAIDSMQLVRGIARLRAAGYVPVVSAHAFGRRYGSYACSDSLRAAELMAAFLNPEIEAIMCARGGYGTVRLLPWLDLEAIRQNPKWLIGYSDISNLHAVMHRAGIPSVHGPMCAHLGDKKADKNSTDYLLQLLASGQPCEYAITGNAYNQPGEAQGILVGGNLLTINGLAETQYDVLNPGEGEDCILFIEDVGEKIYAIERVLMRLHQSGALGKFKGLIFGDFTEYAPSADFQSMEDMIHHWLKEWGYYGRPNLPIVFGFPAGHGRKNYPLLFNAPVTLKVTDKSAELRW